MSVKRKSRFWTGFFSLIPGCAEMYWGFMKTGVSLLALFAVVMFFAVTFEFGPLVLFMMVVWAYGFFHARNMAHMDEEELKNLKDEFLFQKGMFEDWHIFQKDSYRKIAACVLILLGAYLLLEEGLYLASEFLPAEVVQVVRELFDYVPRLTFGIVIIILGALLVRGKKQQLLEENDEED